MAPPPERFGGHVAAAGCPDGKKITDQVTATGVAKHTSTTLTDTHNTPSRTCRENRENTYCMSPRVAEASKHLSCTHTLTTPFLLSNHRRKKKHEAGANGPLFVQQRSPTSANCTPHLFDERAAQELQGADSAVLVGIHHLVLVARHRGQQDASLLPLRALASLHLHGGRPPGRKTSGANTGATGQNATRRFHFTHSLFRSFNLVGRFFSSITVFMGDDQHKKTGSRAGINETGQHTQRFKFIHTHPSPSWCSAGRLKAIRHEKQARRKNFTTQALPYVRTHACTLPRCSRR